MRPILWSALLFLLVGYSVSVFAETYTVMPNHSHVEFLAVGSPGFMRINGVGGRPSGQVDYDPKAKSISGELQVQLEPFTTDMSLRDRHMKEKYLETGKFPVAKLSIKEQAFDLTKLGKAQELKGELSLHGKTKEVPLTVAVDKADGKVSTVHSGFKIELEEFGIDIPSFAGVTVAKDVEVKVGLQAERNIQK